MIADIESFYQRIADAMTGAIPEKWSAAGLHAIFHPQGSTYEAEYVRPDGTARAFQPASDGSRAIRELRRAFKEAGQQVWGQVTFVLRADGSFNAHWDYEGCNADGDAIFDEQAELRRHKERLLRLSAGRPSPKLMFGGSRQDIQKVIAVLESPFEDEIHALLADEGTVFRVGSRQEDETIAESCETVLRTGQLSGELVEVDTDHGYEVYLRYKDDRVRVPLNYSPDDRHITLCTLNRLLAPEFEIRFCIDSNGSDTLAFLPLPCDQWTALERQYGEAVSRRFYQFGERPNLFTDVLPF